MELLPAELRAVLPRLYAQEKIEDPVIHAKFFTPDSNWSWYVTEGQPEDDERGSPTVSTRSPRRGDAGRREPLALAGLSEILTIREGTSLILLPTCEGTSSTVIFNGPSLQRRTCLRSQTKAVRDRDLLLLTLLRLTRHFIAIVNVRTLSAPIWRL